MLSSLFCSQWWKSRLWSGRENFQTEQSSKNVPQELPKKAKETRKCWEKSYANWETVNLSVKPKVFDGGIHGSVLERKVANLAWKQGFCNRRLRQSIKLWVHLHKSLVNWNIFPLFLKNQKQRLDWEAKKRRRGQPWAGSNAASSSMQSPPQLSYFNLKLSIFFYRPKVGRNEPPNYLPRQKKFWTQYNHRHWTRSRSAIRKTWSKWKTRLQTQLSCLYRRHIYYEKLVEYSYLWNTCFNSQLVFASNMHTHSGKVTQQT